VTRRLARYVVASTLASLPIWWSFLATTPQSAAAEPDPPPNLDPHVVVALVDAESLEEFVEDPLVRELRPNTGLIVAQQPILRALVPFQEDEGEGPPDVRILTTSMGSLPSASEGIRTVLEAAGIVGFGSKIARDELVVVTSPAGPDGTDVPVPLLVLEKGASGFVDAVGGTLTSDSTRRAGVVSSLDLAPTILAFLGEPIPEDMPGSVIRVINEQPPVELHDRYVAMREINVPIQYAAMVYVMGAGLLLAWMLRARERFSSRVRSVSSWLGLSVASLAVALLAAGHLPSPSYVTVIPFVLAVTILGTAALIPLRSRGVLVPPFALGIGVLAFFAIEAALGWTAALTPFLGGSQLDGGRFYGLPNVFMGLLFGGGLYVAARLRPFPGTMLIVGVALFCGLPQLGSNIGAAVASFAAAGLWFAIRRRERLDLRALATAAIVVVAGTVVVLLAHSLFPGTPTHATRFVEGDSGGLVGTLLDRLRIGRDLIALNPFALIPTVGIFAVAWVAWRPPASVRPAFDRYPEWRDAVLVCSLAGIVALLANDTGPAAAGLAFGLALGGLFYVSLSMGTERMKDHERAAPAVV